jgi:Thiamine pyrophosphate enzyme, C-terminal TPP binding domain
VAASVLNSRELRIRRKAREALKRAGSSLATTGSSSRFNFCSSLVSLIVSGADLGTLAAALQAIVPNQVRASGRAVPIHPESGRADARSAASGRFRRLRVPRSHGITGLWSAARYHLPATFVILRNDEYGVLKWFATVMRATDLPGLDLPGIDYCAIAKGYGVPAVSIATRDELAAALVRSIGSDSPLLIEVPIRSAS